MTTLPTGQQYQIAFGRYGAVVTEVGASLRSLTLDGREVLSTFAADEVPHGSRGRQLVPWPNRIRDGRYTFDGVERQLPITEVPRNCALHGLGEGMAWRLVSHTIDEVVLTGSIYAQRGWDGVLEVEIGHRLDASGLTVTVVARNVGATRTPYGYGAHPYIAAELATAVLEHPFPTELFVDPERLLPVALGPVDQEHDFRAARPLGDVEFDTALTGAGGNWCVSVTTADSKVTFWADETQTWCQIYTTPARDAIAIEPMTCGPDAFNEGVTHADLIVLEPGGEARSVWGIRVE